MLVAVVVAWEDEDVGWLDVWLEDVSLEEVSLDEVSLDEELWLDVVSTADGEEEVESDDEEVSDVVAGVVAEAEEVGWELMES